MKKKCGQAISYHKIQTKIIADLTEEQPLKRSDRLNMLVLVSDDGIGDKASLLSTGLMHNLLAGLAAKEPLPSALIFMNRGVFLTLETSQSLDVLRDLESKGVLILSNSSCLEYYKVMNKLAVGGVTNVYNIAELMKLTKNTITL